LKELEYEEALIDSDHSYDLNNEIDDALKIFQSGLEKPIKEKKAD